MMGMDLNSLETACFEVNEHGRLISGNKRFCRMFGFKSEDEVMWHYVTDLYRHEKGMGRVPQLQQHRATPFRIPHA
jgi:hypothetical protein